MLIRHNLHIPLALCLFAAVMAGCGDEEISGSGEPFANATGGLNRAGNYSHASIDAPTYFAEMRFDSLGAGFLGTPLPTSYDRVVVVTSDRRLAAIAYNMTEWTYQFPAEEYPLQELACDEEGTVYAVTTNRTLIAVDSAGKQRWRATLHSEDSAGRFDLPTAPLVIPNGVVAGSTNGELVRFDRSGTQIWAMRRGAELLRTIAFSPEFGIVCGLTHNSYKSADTLLSVNEDGSQNWALPFPGMRIECGPAIIGKNVVVGVAGKDTNGRYQPFLLAVDPEGKEQWRTSLPVLPLGLAGDDDGYIYLNSGGGSRMGGGRVFSFSARGEILWDISLPSSIPSRPVVSAEWICFTAYRNQTFGLYTYNREGTFVSFTPIDILSDVNPVPVILPHGSIVLSAQDEPVFLRNASRGVFDFL